jgi:dystrophin
LVFFVEGVNAESIRQASEQLNSRWTEFCQLLSERVNWLEYQTNIITFYNQLQQLEQMTTTAENLLKTQSTTLSEPTAIKSQLKICKVRFSSFHFKHDQKVLLGKLQEGQSKLW